jgi:hypothetical protein
MIKKKLMSQVFKRVNRFSEQELPIKLVELSEKDLSQVCGGQIVTLLGVDMPCNNNVGPSPKILPRLHLHQL